jgi:ribosome recycling factor
MVVTVDSIKVDYYDSDQPIEALARHNTHATCTIGISFTEDIKLRS